MVNLYYRLYCVGVLLLCGMSLLVDEYYIRIIMLCYPIELLFALNFIQLNK